MLIVWYIECYVRTLKLIRALKTVIPNPSTVARKNHTQHRTAQKKTPSATHPQHVVSKSHQPKLPKPHRLRSTRTHSKCLHTRILKSPTLPENTQSSSTHNLPNRLATIRAYERTSIFYAHRLALSLYYLSPK